MILVDTGPLVALFDPRDAHHRRCREALREIKGPSYTTIPVLTEAFHMLAPGSQGAARLGDFVARRGVWIWFMDLIAVEQACGLMEKYADHPMDFADASLIIAAEALDIRRILTLDRNDFSTYRVNRGQYQVGLEMMP